MNNENPNRPEEFRQAAAKTWSRKNELQKAPMNERELREAQKAEAAAARQNPPTPPKPRPDPKEQRADSLEQMQQRSTGVSGHMGAT
jgi:hypothetical protein